LTSSAIRTAPTPGMPRALLTLMVNFACACGDRSTSACIADDGEWSSV
jgi:hypothetical protein